CMVLSGVMPICAPTVLRAEDVYRDEGGQLEARPDSEEDEVKNSSLHGATRSEVVERLGEPEGAIAYGDTEILNFFRGTVELKNGRVVQANVMSREEAQQEEKERLEREHRMREAAEAHRQEMIAEGTAEKERIL